MFDASIAPFSASLLLMFLLVLVEVSGALLGMMPSAMLDDALPDFVTDTDTGSVGAIGKVLGWLSVGRVPTLILLIIGLTTFGLAGFTVQSAWTGAFGAPGPT